MRTTNIILRPYSYGHSNFGREARRVRDMCFINRKKGFTLIELLVVISIIALLMAILIPVLRVAKETATGSVCLNNQHSLAMAWFTYTIDNDGKLVDGDTDNEESWVIRPIDENGSPVSSNHTVDDEKRGIEQGALFSYLKDVDAYNCPGDKRYRKPPTDPYFTKHNGAFRTYAITGCANGESRTNTGEGIYNIELYIQIKNPADKCIFVEEDDPRGFNDKSWKVQAPDNFTVFNWTDRLAVWHNEKSTLGWADGHASMQRWVDKRTTLAVRVRLWDNWRSGDAALDFDGRKGQTGNQDLIFMKKHYPHLGKWTIDKTP